MAIAASGAVSLADFRTEFVGGSSAISLGDLYRGGSHIRAKAGNNTATNLAASVPTSGTIDFADFYSQAKGFRKTYTSGATNQEHQRDLRRRLRRRLPEIRCDQQRCGTRRVTPATMRWQLTAVYQRHNHLTNNGTISGAGGSANGGSGGDALSFSSNVPRT